VISNQNHENQNYSKHQKHKFDIKEVGLSFVLSANSVNYDCLSADAEVSD